MADQILSLGEFEEIVLLAVRHLGNNAYGVPIRQTVEKARGRTTAIGAIYTTLEPLKEWESGRSTRRRRPATVSR